MSLIHRRCTLTSHHPINLTQARRTKTFIDFGDHMRSLRGAPVILPMPGLPALPTLGAPLQQESTMSQERRIGPRISLVATAVLMAAVGACGGGGGAAGTPPPPPPAADLSWLPDELKAADAAAGCPYLRSGRYLSLVMRESVAPEFPVVTVDARALRVSNADGTVETLTDRGRCQFGRPDGGALMVSRAGVLLRYQGSRAFIADLLLPEQAHTLAELAGDWNLRGVQRYDPEAKPKGVWGGYTLAADGLITASELCTVSVPECSDGGLLGARLSATAAGSFDIAEPSGFIGNSFIAYRNGRGDLMLARSTPRGEVVLLTPRVALALPDVGDVDERWELKFSLHTDDPPQTVETAPTWFSSTVASVDRAARSIVNTVVVDAARHITRPESVLLDQPSAGFASRLAADVVDSSGATSSLPAWTALELRGMGLRVRNGDATLVLSIAP